jgi:hypothetical protein
VKLLLAFRTPRKASTVVVWVALGLGLYGAAKPPVTLNDIRFSSEGSTTKVVLELSGKFDFAAEKIEDPDRIFFDFSETKPKAVRSTVSVKSGQLRQIRVGESKPKVTRVVFDLEGASIKYKTFAEPESVSGGVDRQWRSRKGGAQVGTEGFSIGDAFRCQSGN